MEKKHIQYMKRAIELAHKGKGKVNPNPLVGAVIVKDDRIIGEGFHEYFGGPHAEINAFKNATEDVDGASMYVTLEPCSHYGKTPPCAEAIVKNKISKVYIGLKDPNPLVSGKGIQILEENGIETHHGLCTKEITALNKVFLKYIQTKTPYILLKTAMTLDGKIATYTGDSKWISGEDSRAYVHELRNELSAIMVGVDTIIIDDPSLTTRRANSDENNHPIRIILDTNCRIPLSAKVLNSPQRTIIVTSLEKEDNKVQSILSLGKEVLTIPKKDNKIDLNIFMKEIGEMGIDSILLEGGATLNFSALQSGIVDEVNTFIAPKMIGGIKSKTPVEGLGIASINEAICLSDMEITNIDKDILIKGYLNNTATLCSQE
ncbi:MAG: bifunctional diaminohydroxyphosphoribosylaminopyrimidine deaminase/5-amino-6-(5-phosphoribosylamino)uracil reductase RibD [Hyphomicrobiales bacterium]